MESCDILANEAHAEVNGQSCGVFLKGQWKRDLFDLQPSLPPTAWAADEA